MLKNQKSEIGNQKSSGFTLVELLVVITIIGILIALLLPAVQAAREAARRMQCGNNFKQVGLALHNYHAAKGCFPPGMFQASSSYPTAPGYFGWSVYLLPCVEQQAVYDMFTFGQYPPTYYFSPINNANASSTRISAYLCPTDPAAGEIEPGCGALTDMCGVADSNDQTIGTYTTIKEFPAYVNGIFGANGCCRLDDITDGTSNTLMVGEVTGAGVGTNYGHFWSSANLLDTRDGINGPFTAVGGTYSTAWAPPLYGMYGTGFASWHPGGCNFALADGSVTVPLAEHIVGRATGGPTAERAPRPDNPRGGEPVMAP